MAKAKKPAPRTTPPRPATPAPPVADPVALQRRMNDSTRALSERYAAHRAKVMALVPQAEGGTLALLGAGNCNDVDLTALAARFASVHLVDVDGAASRSAVEALPAAIRSSFQVHALDLSGMFDSLPAWRVHPPHPELLLTLASAVSERLGNALGPAVDVVVSSGVLSQLSWTCKEVLGATHPALLAIATAAVATHLRSALSVLRPGGALVLAVDSATDGRFDFGDGTHAATSLERMEAEQAFFPGTSPRLVERIVTSAPGVASLRRRGAWTWRLDDQRTLLVYGMVARRA